MEFLVGQIGMEADTFGHAPVLQQSRVTPYKAADIKIQEA
jgi:hypothetical protein